MHTLLTDPDAFFRAEADSERFFLPVSIVTTVAFLQIVTQYLLLDYALSGMPETDMSLAAFVVPSVVSFVFLVTIWFVSAAAFHAISLVFDGDGPFIDTLRLAGWGWAPAIIGGILTLALTFLVLPGLQPPTDPQAFQAFAEQYQSTGLIRLATGVGVGLVILQGLYWTFAVKHARELSTREAALTVAMPVGLLALWQAAVLL